MTNIIKLGSFSLNGDLIQTGIQCYSGHDTLAFQDTVPGTEISWVDTGDLLVSDRCICIGLSWESLNKAGYISGTRVWIDNAPYICHCLMGGGHKGEKNEWDDLLRKYGDSDDLWHWHGNPFWCQETPPDYGMLGARVVRGGKAPDEWSTRGWNLEIWNIGFRPVLERIPRMTVDFSGLEGREICVYGPHDQSIAGRVLSVDDYDLVLTTNTSLPPNCSWTTASKCGTIIRRGEIWSIKQLN